MSALPLLALALAACSSLNPFKAPVLPQRQVVAGGAWACRDREAATNLLFLGTGAAFQNALSHALENGTCTLLAGDETVGILANKDSLGFIRVQRNDKAKMPYWTQALNLR